MSGPSGGVDQPPGSDQPPGTAGDEVFDAKDACEQNKNQLETLKEIMLRNKQSLKKKEEEVQEYARKLSKIKSRAKLSRRSRDASSSVEGTPEAGAKSQISSPVVENFDDVVDDISQAKTPKAKSSLLQKKLAENRKIFEQRSREITENKRAVEEKVEAIRQQLDESDTTTLELQKELPTVVPVQPVLITTQVSSPVLQHYNVQDKDNRIAELSNKVLQLEASVLDLEENLKEKDSVIDSKTKAITLMSADLSKKSKSTLDTLEDTKDEMRTMQANFVLIETSLKHKIDSLLQQLQGRDGQIAEFENTVEGLKEDLEKRRITDTTTADFSRSTLDTLAETKDAMKSMQENFILIESSLKSKNDNLLEQLQERETKLAAAEERIFKLESGAGIVAPPNVRELQSRLEIVEQRNRQLQDEKYELQKSIAELQDKVISNEPAISNGLIVEKDNRIAELENLIEELRKSNQLLLEESKTELQEQIVELSTKNEEYSNKINDLEKLVHNLETEKNELVKRIPEDSDEGKEDAKVAKLSKELDDLNKSTIKLKALHKSKVKSLQKQLESFKKVSDANAELVKLGNQVTLLEEEKGNLQLSLVDFDELKASAGDWQERIADLETKISAQSNEIDSQVQAIATLENQKLDLMQELHTVKQEVSALEAENAESENLRVTAEMKVVELEEQLDALHKSMVEPKQSDSANELEKHQYLDRIESLTQENNNLIIKLAKLEEKGTSDAGSTESFETFHETDRNELLKKIELLTAENNELIIRLTKLEEKTGSSDSFETLNDSNKNELLKKIDLLAQENNNLIVKLSKLEEKSSSDSGSTESFERIPEHVDNLSRMDLLTQENNELVIKLIKLEEKLALIEDSPNHGLKSEPTTDGDLFNLENRVQMLTEENNGLVIQLTKLQEKMGENLPQQTESSEAEVEERVKALTDENNSLVVKVTRLGEKYENLKINLDLVTKERDDLKGVVDQMTTNTFAKELIEKLNELNKKNQSSAQGIREEITQLLRKLTEETFDVTDVGKVEDSEGHQGGVTASLIENEIEDCKKFISEQKEIIEDMKSKLSEKQEELELQTKKIADYEAAGENLDKLQTELKDTVSVIEEWKLKCNEMEEKMKILESEKASIEEGLRILEAENANLVKQSEAKDLETISLKKELDDTISQFESKLNEELRLASAREEEIAALKEVIAQSDADLHDKYQKLQNEMITIDALQDDLNNYKTQFEGQRNTIESLTGKIEELNAALANRIQETSAAGAEIQRLRTVLDNSRSLEEFNRLVKTLNENQEIMRQMQNKIDEQADENVAAQNQIQDITSNIHNLKEELNKKEGEIAQLTNANRSLHEELNQAKTIGLSTTAEMSHLQSTLEQNNIYLEDLRKELSDAYKKLELVKAQHMEDIGMQNRRLEDLIEELNSKTQENESLKSEIEEKQKLLGQNVTEETKLALELKVKELEEKIVESETKGKAQLDKMKKIAAHLKKKTTQCQDLEAKVSDLEEKWNSEKCEKEAINKSIQENESVIREKDNKISELEKRVQESGDQASMALENVGGLMQEIDISKEKVNSLLEQVTEMGEEIERLRAEINAKASELAEERTAKQNIESEYQAYVLKMETDYENQQQNLEEATERARELRVRMEVMESEYVEQLSLIQKLKAENGMLSSKETQINEKLENVEKESEERKYLLEKLQKEKADVIARAEAHKAQSLDYELGENVTNASQEQSQISIQALEAKLQERDAVIESLEIELGKSNDRINKLDEALVAVEERRYSLEKRTELLGAELEQSFRITEEASFSEDMLEQRLATLVAKDEAISERLNETLDENNELTEKIQSLQDLNISLQERIDAVEEELKYGRETNEKLQNVDVLYSELLQKNNLLETELKKAQQELRSAKQHIDSSEREVTSQINQLDSEKRQLLEKCEKLEDLNTNLVQEIESLKDGVSLCRQRISELEAEVETHKEVNGQLLAELNKRKEAVPTLKEEPEHVEKLKSILAEKEIEIENYQRRNMQLQMAAFDAPKTFDASSAFDTTTVSPAPVSTDQIDKLGNLLSEKERQYTEVCRELEHLKQQLLRSESEYEKLWNEKEQYSAQLVTELQNLQTEYNQCQNQLVRVNEIVFEKDRQIESLRIEVGDFRARLEKEGQSQGNYVAEIARLSGMVTRKDEEIETVRKQLDLANDKLKTISSSERENNSLLKNVKSVYESELDGLKLQQREAEEIVSQIISAAEQKVNKFYESTETTGLSRVASTFNELLADFENLKLEKDELLLSRESYANEIIELRKQLTANTSDTNIKQSQELQNQLLIISQEKNALLESLQMQELAINEVRKELGEVLALKESLEKQVSDLTSTINQLRNQQAELAVDNNVERSMLESRPAEETVEKTVRLELGSEWDTGSTGKLEIEEEGWGWGAEEAQLEEQHHLSTAPLTPSVEIQLQARVAELEDQVKDLEAKKNIFDEESKAVQLKNIKLVKKLKEFKVQNEQLQQRLKQQQSSSFSDLDSAIEEELKSQIERLEKSLKDAMQEQKKTVSEKEHLQKRLEVLTAANERFVEMKERQDMDIEVWQIRNKELTNKIQSLEWQLQEISSNTNEEGYSMPSSQTESQIGLALSEANQSSTEIPGSHEQADQLSKQYKAEIDDLKEEMEALASENEQLQHLLEEQKKNISAETKAGMERTDEFERLVEQNKNLQSNLNKVQEEYSLLRKQYEQSLMDANDQVTAMRQNNDLLRTEFETKSAEFENEKQSLVKKMEDWTLRANEVQQNLQQARQENSELLQKIETLKPAEDKLSSVSISLAEVTELLNTRVQEVADLKQHYQQQYLEREEAESQLRNTIEQLSQELSNKQEEILNLRQSLSVGENEIARQQSAEMHSLQLELINKEQEIEKLRDALADKQSNALKEDAARIETLEKEVESLRTILLEKESSIEKITAELTIKYQELAEKESYLEWYKVELPKYSAEIERNQRVISELNNVIGNQTVTTDTGSTNLTSQWSEELHRVNGEVSQLRQQLEEKNLALEQLNKVLVERDTIVEKLRQELNEKQREIDSIGHSTYDVKKQDTVALADSFPRFKMSGNDDLKLETDVEKLRSELKEKEEEIEHLKYMLNENTYPAIIQQLQDNVSQLHNDKYQMEQSLEKRIQTLNEELASKQTEIGNLRQQASEQHRVVRRESFESVATERPLIFDQESIAKLQNELHAKEQEINELRYVIAEKDSQISLQANSGPQFDEFEAQETLQRLNGDLYAKQQEVEQLKATLAEKEKDIENLKAIKYTSEDDKELISKLTLEKELIKEESERLLQSRLAEKEVEIEKLKQLLEDEKQELLDTLQLRDKDIENLKIEMAERIAEADQQVYDALDSNDRAIENLRIETAEYSAAETQQLYDALQAKDSTIAHLELALEHSKSAYNSNLDRKNDELIDLETELSDIRMTKDTEIQNLKVQIHDKDVRIQELVALTEEEKRQSNELRQTVESKEGEINNLKLLLAETVQEYEIIQMALKRATSSGSANLDSADSEAQQTASSVASRSDDTENLTPRSGVVSVEGELDLALYMLHQRDVRCEELTLELMQLLEERDTLQLRLSNAIRVNEELRRQKSATSSPKIDSPSTSLDEPLVEHPSPSRTDGPVEIAKEALHVETSPLGADRDVLAEKLSQLHTVHQRRDVTLCDERESRHTQQMSFVARRDMLSSLPPEAAARLVNANYTLSRDVQSQSSVLMNWLWGKSTPKVMHM